MNAVYNFINIEKNAQKYWQDNDSFKAVMDPNKEKFYCLSMFPYPSGSMHVGHIRNFTISDAISRYQTMLGKNVLHPFGWDAFGMPAENAAIKANSSPATWTYANIDNSKTQLKRFGFSFDWDREVKTCDPEYYRWEQWLFTRLVNKGLAYKKKATVNWCNVDTTVLANEQVEDGKCWRCGTPVVQKELMQWFLKITDYSQELLDDIDQLTEWPERVRTQQRNWIGRSVGLNIDFKVENYPNVLTVYTTRPDTIYGVTCITLASTHELATLASQNDPKMQAFIEECKEMKVTTKELEKMEKKGYFTGYYAIHPFTQEKVPVYIANFVLGGYGTGAVMCVPAHDKRDHEFAKKYNLAIKQVIELTQETIIAKQKKLKEDEPLILDVNIAPIVEHGILINSDEFTGNDFDEAFVNIIKKAEEMKLGEATVNFKLRDWGVSRQRYWGAPIPIVYDADGNMLIVADEDLPVVLAKDVQLGSVNPLTLDSWKNVTYQGQPVTRETDTFDTFMESSWYFARYTSPHTDTAMFDPIESRYWLPVDMYIGGIEHAILHLLYSRFFQRLLHEEGLVDQKEPFKRLICQGMVNNDAFFIAGEDKDAEKADSFEKIYINLEDVEIVYDAKKQISHGIQKSTGLKLSYAGLIKMSKSKNNGVDLDELLAAYGADAVRLFLMFAAPIEADFAWKMSGIEGSARFLKRIWKLTTDFIDLGKLNQKLNPEQLTSAEKALRSDLHKMIKKFTDDVEQRVNFNTAIAATMEFFNTLTKYEIKTENDYAIYQEAIEALLLLLSPITPHICFELWSRLGKETTIDKELMVKFDPLAVVNDVATIVVQINGKLRSKLEVAVGSEQATVEALAFADDNVVKFTEGKEIAKVIYVKDKILNIVVKG